LLILAAYAPLIFAAPAPKLPGLPVAPRNGALEHLASQRFGPKAQAIVRMLHERPGLNIDELAVLLGVRRTAANHHVRTLERAGLVVRMRQSRHQLHFAGDTNGFERTMLCALRVPSVQDVAQKLFEGAPPSSSDLAAALDVSARTARRALRLLGNLGLLRIESPGGRRVAHLHPALRLVLARTVPEEPSHAAP
jgi:DNA-binding transcriptional ArsR family regulator